MQAYFDAIAGAIDRALAPGERHATWFAAEDTDFVRMNRGKVRQPGHVAQRYAEIRLIHGARHASHALSLTGDATADASEASAAVGRPARRSSSAPSRRTGPSPPGRRSRKPSSNAS